MLLSEAERCLRRGYRRCPFTGTGTMGALPVSDSNLVYWEDNPTAAWQG